MCWCLRLLCDNKVFFVNPAEKNPLHSHISPAMSRDVRLCFYFRTPFLRITFRFPFAYIFPRQLCAHFQRPQTTRTLSTSSCSHQHSTRLLVLSTTFDALFGYLAHSFFGIKLDRIFMRRAHIARFSLFMQLVTHRANRDKITTATRLKSI